MTTNFKGEMWKAVALNYDIGTEYRLEVSNHGRVRTFNKISNGNILKGSTINGYPIIRVKLFLKRSAETETELQYLRGQVLQLKKSIPAMAEAAAEEANLLLETVQKSVKNKDAIDTKQRTIYYQVLTHRLVATHFVNRPGADHTIVAHLDYDKLNNHHHNLKWMTAAENRLHQQRSPHVLAEMDARRNRNAIRSRTKLTVTKVMLLKKLLNLNKPMKTLVKQFKITETQIKRIQRGENWGDIEAAK